MSTKAASKMERGTKRTCQNAECGARFYDLGRASIICPICNATYAPELAGPTTPSPNAKTHWKHVKKAVPEIKPEPAAETDELEEEPAVTEDDETLIEEVEDDSPDVAAIIDAPIEPDEKA